VSISSSPGRHPVSGFTMIEVLIAMVLLAVGLMSLQALSVHAFGSVARAEQTSRATVLASERLEEALIQLRNGVVPANLCAVIEGDTLSRRIDLTNPNMPAVDVTAVARSSSGTRRPITLSSFIYAENPIVGIPGGSSCSGY
jgi:prepilin-type N-terminal cleavage/methylation domain-containing protein